MPPNMFIALVSGLVQGRFSGNKLFNAFQKFNENTLGYRLTVA